MDRERHPKQVLLHGTCTTCCYIDTNLARIVRYFKENPLVKFAGALNSHCNQCFSRRDFSSRTNVKWQICSRKENLGKHLYPFIFR